MEGIFNKSPQLDRICERLEQHKPFLFIALDKTGTDVPEGKDGFGEHEPIKVMAIEYEYNNETNQYEQGLVFDEYVKCDTKAFEEALDKNTFAKLNIDKDEYFNGTVRGKVVLDKEDFKNRLFRIINSLKDKDIIMVEDYYNVSHYLEKIAPEVVDVLKATKEHHTCFELIPVSKDFYNKETYISQKKLYSLLDCDGTYDNSESKVTLMFKLIQAIGREKGYLNSESKEAFDKAYKKEHDFYSNAGRKEYEKASTSEKLDILISKKILDPEKILERSGDCALNKLFDIFDRKSKGFTLMSVATTGFTAGNDPIQITLRSYNLLENGKAKGFVNLSFNIAAEDNNIEKALQRAKDGDFDAFEYAGINVDEYRAGINSNPPTTLSPEAMMKKVNGFFSKCPPENYPIITMGQDTRNKRSFAQSVLMKYGNIQSLDAPYIDFAQVLKEYVYLVERGNKFESNALIPPNSNLKDFSLDEIAKANNFDSIRGTLAKCKTIDTFMKALAEQYHTEYGKVVTVQEIKSENKDKQTETNIDDTAIKENAETSINEINTDDVKTIKNTTNETISAKLESITNNLSNSNNDYISSDILNMKVDSQMAEAQINSVPQPFEKTEEMSDDDLFEDMFDPIVPDTNTEESQTLDSEPSETAVETRPSSFEALLSAIKHEEDANLEEKSDSKELTSIESFKSVNNDVESEKEPESLEDALKTTDTTVEDIVAENNLKDVFEEFEDDFEDDFEEDDYDEDDEGYNLFNILTSASQEFEQEQTESKADTEAEKDTELEENSKEEVPASEKEEKAESQESSEKEEQNTSIKEGSQINDKSNLSYDFSALFELMSQVSSSINTLNDKVDSLTLKLNDVQSSIEMLTQKQESNENAILKVSLELSQLCGLEQTVIQSLINGEQKTDEMNSNINKLNTITNAVQSEQKEATKQLTAITALIDKGRKMQNAKNKSKE